MQCIRICRLVTDLKKSNNIFKQYHKELDNNLTIDLLNLSSAHTSLLNSISIDIKKDYNLLIRNILEKTDKRIHWIVCPLISRNNWFGTLFMDLCYVELVKNVFANENITKFILPSNRVKVTLKTFFKDSDKFSFIVVESRFSEFFNSALLFCKSFIKNILTSFVLLLNSNTKNRKSILNLNRQFTLVDTYVTNSEFKNGKYKSRFYNKANFWNNINKNLKNDLFFVPELEFSVKQILSSSLTNSIKGLNNSEENFLFKHDFLNVQDFFFALLAPFKTLNYDFSKITFRGFNISTLLKYDLKRNLQNTNSFYGILNYRFLKNLKSKNVELKKIILWFENQPSDKGFSAGVKDFFPNIIFKGFQNFVVSYHYNHHLIPTVYESELKIIPNEILVIGKKIIPLIKEFNKDLNVSLAPGLRFQHLYNIKREKEISNIIFICLPMDLKAAINIINVSSDFLTSLSGYNLFLRPHPNTDLKSIIKLYPTFFSNIKIVNDNLDAYLKKSKVLISAASTICFESIACGIPTIVIEIKSELNRNPIPYGINPIIWRVCYEKSAFIKSINLFLSYGIKDLKKLIIFSNELKRNYFKKVTKENVNFFVKN